MSWRVVIHMIAAIVAMSGLGGLTDWSSLTFVDIFSTVLVFALLGIGVGYHQAFEFEKALDLAIKSVTEVEPETLSVHQSK